MWPPHFYNVHTRCFTELEKGSTTFLSWFWDSLCRWSQNAQYFSLIVFWKFALVFSRDMLSCLLHVFLPFCSGLLRFFSLRSEGSGRATVGDTQRKWWNHKREGPSTHQIHLVDCDAKLAVGRMGKLFDCVGHALYCRVRVCVSQSEWERDRERNAEPNPRGCYGNHFVLAKWPRCWTAGLLAVGLEQGQ